MERWKRPHCNRGSVDAAAPALVSVNSYHPSFSSSLLDAIDRSIDKGCGAVNGARRDGRATDCAAPAVRLHHYAWQEDAADAAKQRDAYGRRGTGEYDQPQQHSSRVLPQQRRRQRDRFVGNSTSSSSESSYGGFSSSEAESVAFHGHPLPRPVRTTAPPLRKPEQMMTPLEEISKQKPNKSSIRSRFRASKFYGELKKGTSTPVSPGARLASFLNTLFSTAGHPKKAKISTANNTRRGGDDSACSSASSYSRSCLSKTPSSRGKAPSSGGSSSAKRSVRFYPVSVIVDEDCRPCGQKSIYEGQRPGFHRPGAPSSALEHALPGIRIIGKEPPLLESTRCREEPLLPSYLAAMAEVEERKRAREAARSLVNAYKEKKRGLDGFAMDDDDEEYEDDDAASYSSSDLFELKNLATAGCGGDVRYRDELPVYETTRLDANRAISRGLLV